MITGNNETSLNLNESTVVDNPEVNQHNDPLLQHKQPSNLLSRSNSAKNGLGTNIRNPNNLLSSIATTSSSSVTNNKRSTTFNNGSNVHEDSTMYFYGSKSMDILDNKLDQSITSQISILSFNYIDFDDNLCKNFSRIKNKFPNTMVSFMKDF